MKQITCIFFGKSGSGKGTQAELLIQYLKKHDSKNATVYIETGDGLRKLVKKGGSYTADLTHEVLSKGTLMPASLPIWVWSSILMGEIKTGKEHLVFDGVARRIEEAPILDQALQFYKMGKPHIILLDVPEHEATDRLIKRGRHDDLHEKIKERLKWFDTDVMPSIHYFKKSPTCAFLHINGHQSIEKVHEDVLKELGI
jgi:adenylate kinase family enzyme